MCKAILLCIAGYFYLFRGGIECTDQPGCTAVGTRVHVNVHVESEDSYIGEQSESLEAHRVFVSVYIKLNPSDKWNRCEYYRDKDDRSDIGFKITRMCDLAMQPVFSKQTFMLVKFDLRQEFTHLCNTTALIELDNEANTKGVIACYFEEIKFVKVKYQFHIRDETKTLDSSDCLLAAGKPCANDKCSISSLPCNYKWLGKQRCGRKPFGMQCNSDIECQSGRCAGSLFRVIESKTDNMLTFCAKRGEVALFEKHSCSSTTDCAGLPGSTCHKDNWCTKEANMDISDSEPSIPCANDIFCRIDVSPHAPSSTFCNQSVTSEIEADNRYECKRGNYFLDDGGLRYATGRDIFVIIRVRKVSFLCDTCSDGEYCSMSKRRLKIDHFYTSVVENGALDDILGARNERCQKKVDSSSTKTLLQLWCQSEGSDCKPNIVFESRDTKPVKFDQKPVAVVKLENHADEDNSEIVDYYWDTNDPGVFIDFEAEEFSVKVSGTPDAQENNMYTLTIGKSELVQMHINEMFNLNQISSPYADAFDDIDCGGLEKKYRYCFGSLAFIDGQATSSSFNNVKPQIGMEIDYIFGVGIHEFTNQHELKPPKGKLIKLAERLSNPNRN